MKIERTKNATRNIAFGTILKIYQILLPFIMRTAMIYFMGVEYLGLNSLFTSVLQVLSLAELGVGSALVFSMYKPIVEDDTEMICALMNLYKKYYRIIGLVIAVIGVALTPIIPHLVKSDLPSGMNLYILYYLNLSATVVSYWLFGYMNSLFQAHQRIDVTNKVTLITNTVMYVAQFAVLYFLRDYYIYLVVALLTQMFTNILTAILSRKMYPLYKAKGKLDKEQIKKINRRVRDLFTAKLGAVVVGSVDTLVISAFLGLTDLAIYQNYYFIMNSVFGFFMVFMTSCLAGIGNSIVSETKEKNVETFHKLTFIVFWIVAFCSSCLLCMYQPFMKLWIKKDAYMLSYGCVICFVLYFALFTINQFWCTYKDAAGIWHKDRFRPLTSAICNLILNISLVKVWGLYAIVLSTVISYLIVAMPWLLYNLFSVLFKGYFWNYFKKVLVYFGVVVINSALCFGISSALRINNRVLEIVVSLIICIVINAITFIILFRKTKPYKDAMDVFDTMSKGKLHSVFSLLSK